MHVGDSESKRKDEYLTRWRQHKDVATRGLRKHVTQRRSYDLVKSEERTACVVNVDLCLTRKSGSSALNVANEAEVLQCGTATWNRSGTAVLCACDGTTHKRLC